MGDETKKEEALRGNTRPLAGTLKPTTAQRVDPDIADVAEMPNRDQAERLAAVVRDRPQR
jgi:hypothetical protein